MGAILWGAPGTVAVGWSAAALLGLRGCRPGPIEISSRRRGKLPGATLHYDKTLPARPRRSVDGIPIPPVEQVLLQIADRLNPLELGRLLDDARREGITNLDRLDRFLARGRGRGVTGVRALREAVDRRTGLSGLGDSEAEHLFMVQAKRRRIPVVHHHLITSDGRRLRESDFALLAEKIDIEIDGYQFHVTDLAAFHRDRKIDAELGRLGWQVLRFTYDHLEYQIDWVFDTIEQIREERSRQLRLSL